MRQALTKVMLIQRCRADDLMSLPLRFHLIFTNAGFLISEELENSRNQNLNNSKVHDFFSSVFVQFVLGTFWDHFKKSIVK